jgi:S-methylmethionine-dependent homocysteine/selenocysteine methylase
MSAKEAEAYHAEQIGVFRDTAADLVSGFTLNYADEAIGIARAAKAAGIPVVISLTVETDGHLPTEQALKDAIHQIDTETGSAPAYYMINCAHPTHFESALVSGELGFEDCVEFAPTPQSAATPNSKP